MLDGRVDYILVDDFDKETALKFMDFLAKEVLNKELSEDDKELIYSYVGGKPKLIIRVINKLDRMGLREVLDNMLKDAIKPKVVIGEDIIEIKKRGGN
jgi:AAA+ ATPase superfamily predicted ATPase